MIEQILQLLQKNRGGLSYAKISATLHLRPKEKTRLKKNLRNLLKKGVITQVRKKYILPGEKHTVRGELVTVLRGFGFVKPKKTGVPDIFIPARFSGGAIQGDIVDVVYLKKGEKPEGRIIRIVKKRKKTILGIYKEFKGRSFYLPFESPSLEDIPIETGREDVNSGMIVEVDRARQRIIDVLGMPDDPGVDIEVITRKHGIPREFPEEVTDEVQSFPETVKEQDRRGRRDLRNWRTVTIDGENARDFDDAVSIKRRKQGGFYLGVHIADVSHYVRPETPLDGEAANRGTSVYFPDTVIPMLPEKLSNQICSLKPDEDKLTVSVLMKFDKDGRRLDTDFFSSVIRTKGRMTYTSVYEIFQKEKKEKETHHEVVSDLLDMRKLASLLRQNRMSSGSLDFDHPQPELIYRHGALHKVVPFFQNEAHRLIEEFMLAANQAVAEYLDDSPQPFIYRIHPAPDPNDLEKLREILRHFGVSLPPAEKITRHDLQQVMDHFKGREEEKFITIQVLRSLSLAVYSDENKGHYGLGKDYYTHFTSPIRRYPDLIAHRILKSVLKNEESETSALSTTAVRCSDTERRADEAEKEVINWRIYRMLKSKIGEMFTGFIADIIGAGVVVELDDYFVSGVILFQDLDHDYYFRKSEKTLRGRRTGKTYELGDRLNVQLLAVNPELARISLKPVN
jgi:ribonuclease R